MGLSGRKEKQRIPADPRNLSWADDAAKFGQSYLAKMGWDPSKGLGATGEGRTSHIKVSHKLDMLGIGAAHTKDPNGIAWKQNKDFEDVLRRLNDSASKNNADNVEVGKEVDEAIPESDVASVSKSEKKRKRRKERDAEDKKVDEVVGGDEATSVGKSEKKRKRKKEEDVEEKKSKKSKKSKELEAGPSQKPSPDPPVQVTSVKRFTSRVGAHRARAVASKNIRSKSAAEIAEILGVAPTPLTSASNSAYGTPGTLTPLDDSPTLEKLTTSTKSVADYFKEKLLARSSKSSSVNSGATTPEQDIGPSDSPSYDAPRSGIGSSRLRLG